MVEIELEVSESCIYRHRIDTACGDSNGNIEDSVSGLTTSTKVHSDNGRLSRVQMTNTGGVESGLSGPSRLSTC